MVAIGMPGLWEWVVILVIVLIFFGAGKLPEVFGQAGKAMRAFRDASNGDDAPGASKSKRQAAIAQDDDLDDPPAVGAARPRTRAGDE